MTKFKPLLSATITEDDFDKIRFPVMASPKLDGIRCVKIDGKALSRTLKPIPNKFIREWIEANLPDGIDGEIMLRDLTRPYDEVQSAVMSRDGEPDFVFMAFDWIRGDEKAESHTAPFRERYETLIKMSNDVERRKVSDFEWCRKLVVVPHQLCETEQELRDVAAMNLSAGHEGTMIRCLDGPYKFGRSTVKEGILCKIKPFADDDATVIGVVQQMHNENEPKKDNLGRTKRSSAKAGKVPAGKMGALQCRMDDGTEFEVGTGFTDKQRVDLWESHGFNAMNHASLVLGRRLKFKHLPPPGGRKRGQAPRHPVFLCWRED